MAASEVKDADGQLAVDDGGLARGVAVEHVGQQEGKHVKPLLVPCVRVTRWGWVGNVNKCIRVAVLRACVLNRQEG